MNFYVESFLGMNGLKLKIRHLQTQLSHFKKSVEMSKEKYMSEEGNDRGVINQG